VCAKFGSGHDYINSNLKENFKFAAKKLVFISIFSFTTGIFSSFDRLNRLTKE
jgi:hypothetical protein